MTADDTAASRQIALVGDRSPEGDPYKVGDPVWWADQFGHKVKAVVVAVFAPVLEIKVHGRSGTYYVFTDELSPRTDDCPEGTEK